MFSVLSETSSVALTPSPMPWNQILSNPITKGQNWADITDDDDEVFEDTYPPLGNIEKKFDALKWAKEYKPDLAPLQFPIEKKFDALKWANETKNPQKEKKSEKRAFQRSLTKLKEIKIDQSKRVFDVQGCQNGSTIFTRTLRVTTKEVYNSILNLVNLFKTHDKKTGRLSNRREQLEKIKLSNSLLELTYKIPDQPRFIYHVAIITLTDGRTLTRCELTKDSTASFELEERFYEPVA